MSILWHNNCLGAAMKQNYGLHKHFSGHKFKTKHKRRIEPIEPKELADVITWYPNRSRTVISN